MNTSLKSPRPAFHPATTCSTGTLVLQHAHKGNVQVEKTGEEQRLQNPFASEINGIQAEKKSLHIQLALNLEPGDFLKC